MNDEERKETLFKTEYGRWKGWVESAIIALVAAAILLFLIGSITGLVAISAKYEVRAFNRIHGTDYSFGEWFWAETTIKGYHLGTVENKNYQVDLNIEGLKGGK